MPRKTRSMGGALTSPTKNAPNKPRGRLAKIQGKNQPAGSSIDALVVPIVEPPEKVPEEAVDCPYPFDNPSEILERDLNRTIQAVRKAVTGVLDEHNVRCSIPIDEMSMISKRIKTMLVDRKLDRVKGSSDDLKETLNEAFGQLALENDDYDESFLRQELIKRILISICQFDKLSLGTVMSMVQDLNDSAKNIVKYENGYPAKIAPTVSKFYDLTDKEFCAQTPSIQLKMKKDYVKELICYCEKVGQFLKESHERLKERRNDDPINPWMDYPEGQEKEEQLMESFKKNQDRARLLKMEYEDLDGKVLCQSAASEEEPKEEPMDLLNDEIAKQSFPKVPKEEPLDLASFENEIPQQNLMGEKICKEEEIEMDEDEMAPSDFDVSAFGPPVDHFPIPLVVKEEIIEAEEIEEDGENGENTEYVAQNPQDDDVGRYRADFRAMCRERNGVMTKEQEEQIDKDFELSPFGVIKCAVDNWKKKNGDGMDENAIEIEMKMGPSIKTNK